MLSSQKYKLSLIELFLGLGLGLGYMTSLRFAGPVGISELLILFSLILLFQNHGWSLFRYDLSNPAGIIKIYMLSAVFLLLPLMTMVTMLFAGFKTAPEYIISFMMGISLAFLLVEALKHKRINMANVVLWFAFAYILTNLLTIFFFPSALESARYTGTAKNPNQLMFYATSLSMLLVIYRPKLSFVLVPIVLWITMKSGSDAYLLTLFVTLAVYLMIVLLFSWRFSFGVGLLFSVLVGLALVYFILTNYMDELVLLWLAADEGNSRTSLMIHAWEVSLTSPILGYGAGSFSGYEKAFLSSEAHNTFLDFSMQFGIIFSAIIYYVFFAFLFNRIKNGYYIQAAFVAAFIVSGLFHFTGRHFFFWVEFAIFYYYIFYHEKKTVMTKLDVQKKVDSKCVA